MTGAQPHPWSALLKRLQLVKETLGTLNADEQMLRGVNGGMAADTSIYPTGCATGDCSISIIGHCSAVRCFPSTNCTFNKAVDGGQ